MPGLIGPDEVAAWLSDSVVKRVTFHRTSPESALRTRHPLIGSLAEIEPIIDEMGRRLRPRAMGRMNRDVAATVRRELILLGYDGLVIHHAGGDGIDYVVAILRETVKVVRP